MIAKTSYLTEQGRTRLQAELERLRTVDRLDLIERLADTRTGGDWMDCAENALVQQELSFVEARIRELEVMLDTAEIIPDDCNSDHVSVGGTVVLETAEGDVETYTIVGAAETDPAAGLISNESPLGQALLNRCVGDEVVVSAPAGDVCFRVVDLA